MTLPVLLRGAPACPDCHGRGLVPSADPLARTSDGLYELDDCLACVPPAYLSCQDER